MNWLFKLQFLGPLALFVATLSAELAAKALEYAPSSEFLWFVNLRMFGIGRIRTSAGPQAPELQPVSKKPFKSMLCNSSWLNPGGQLPGWVCRAAG